MATKMVEQDKVGNAEPSIAALEAMVKVGIETVIPVDGMVEAI